MTAICACGGGGGHVPGAPALRGHRREPLLLLWESAITGGLRSSHIKSYTYCRRLKSYNKNIYTHTRDRYTLDMQPISHLILYISNVTMYII